MSQIITFESHELNNDQYHGDTSKLTNSTFSHLSSSGMKKLLESPQAYKEIYIDGFHSVGSDAMNLGSYVHGMILEPHTVATDFAVFTGARRAGQEWNEFKSINHGKCIITQKDFELAQKMYKAFHASKHCSNLIKHGEGRPEVSYFGNIADVGVKVRADWLRDSALKPASGKGADIVDLKTTSSILTDEEIANVIRKYAYDLSAALYVDLVSAHDGLEHDFYLVFVSKVGDCSARAWRVSPEMINFGRKRYRRAIDQFKDCILNGWDATGEPDDIPDIRLPEHAFVDYADQMKPKY